MPAGKPRGAISKDRRQLLMVLQAAHPEWDPVLQLADMANDSELDIRLRFDAAKEVAQYVRPKLRSVEVTTDESSPPRLVIEWATQSTS